MATTNPREKELSPESSSFLGLLNVFVLIVFLLFGSIMGFMMARLFAGTSGLALIVAVVAFPLSYVISTVLAMNVLPLDALWRKLPRQHYELVDSSVSQAKIEYRRRSLVAIPISVLVCAAAGLVVGYHSPLAATLVTLIFAFLGVAYGCLYYIFAQFELLPSATG